MLYSTKLRHILQEFKPCLKQQFRNKFTLKKSGQSQVPRPVPSVYHHQVATFKKSFDKLGGWSFTRLFTYVRVSLLNNGLFRIGQWRSIIGLQTWQVRSGQTAANSAGIYEKAQKILRLHFLRDKFLLINQLKLVDAPGSGAGKGGGAGGTVREAGGSLGKKGAVQEERHFRKRDKRLLEEKKKKKKPKTKNPKRKK